MNLWEYRGAILKNLFFSIKKSFDREILAKLKSLYITDRVVVSCCLTKGLVFMSSCGAVDLEKINKKLQELKENAISDLASITSTIKVGEIKAKYLGKKGEIKQILQSLKSLSSEEKKELGKLVNSVKEFLEEKIKEKMLEATDSKVKHSLALGVDVSAPGRGLSWGGLHPLEQTSQDICQIFCSMGFIRASGPEIEHDFYNFEALNIPKTHPARDMQDTFYVTDDVMLRTHTSGVQIRAMMLKKSPPIRIISFGRVYRRDDDVTHSPMFHQIEGLCVDKDVSMSDLKDSLEIFVKNIFSSSSKIRMRPSFFPFTEPSIEVDVSCFACKKSSNCRICKSTGWVEILGAGMVDPNVLTACNIDPEEYQGFAFGLGVERIAMLRYGITDIRLFFENDLRFLRQFR